MVFSLTGPKEVLDILSKIKDINATKESGRKNMQKKSISTLGRIEDN